MAVLILTSGFGCVGLRTSSLIIGYFNMVVSVMFSTIMLLGIVGDAALAGEGLCLPGRGMFLAITLLYFLLMLVFAVVLLIGVYKANRDIVRLYLAGAVFLVVKFSLLFFLGIISFAHSYSSGAVLVRITIIGVQAYSCLVVRSYHKTMEPQGVILFV